MDKAWFSNNCWPGWKADEISRLLRKNSGKLGELTIVLPAEIKVSEKTDEIIAEIKTQFDTRKTIEDKAKTVLGSVAVAVTAVTFAINNQSLSFERFAGTVSLIILAISIFNFIMATIRAIQTLNITPFYSGFGKYRIEEDCVHILPNEEGKERLELFFQYKLLNDNNSVRKSNYAFAAFVLLRNGIISFTAFFFVALINKKAERPNPDEEDKFHFSIPIEIKRLPFSDTTFRIDTVIHQSYLADTLKH